MTLNWRAGLAAQAISDYALFNKLMKTQGVERCHQLHYLQMATEKVAKHFLLNQGQAPKLSHTQFVRFLQHAKWNTGLMHACHFPDKSSFAAYLDDLLPTAHLIDGLAPKGTMDNVNPEYPWMSGGAERLEIPCQYAYPEFDPKTSLPIKEIMLFIRNVFEFIKPVGQ